MAKTREAAPHDIWFSANVYLILFTLWVATIVFMNTMPGDSIPGRGFFSQIPHFDKVVHFTQYSVLMLILWNGISATIKKLGTDDFPKILLLFPFAFAILDELSQIPVPGRQADILDLLTDWFAAGLVLFLAKMKSR